MTQYPERTREPLKPYVDKKTARAYLLSGRAAEPYDKQDREINHGFVRLSLTEFSTDTNETGIDLHLGKGTWEGGYVCMVDEEIEDFTAFLANPEAVGQTSLTVQGKFIDLTTFIDEYGENYEFKLAGDYAENEVMLSMQLDPISSGSKTGFELQLGEHKKEGATVEFTHVQRIDLLESIQALKDHDRDSLPGDYSGYPRIGPDGSDTWGMGTDIEHK